jgi:hypothetical protein
MNIRTLVGRPTFALLALCAIPLAGCAGSNNGDVLDPSKSALNGTWEYLVTNAFEATFTGCSGDATVLEGATLYEGLSLAPICMSAVTFAVSQDGDAFEVPEYQVVCSDGASGSVSGGGQIANPDLGGQWDSVSDQGVSASQTFTGSIFGNTILLSESHREFSGSFQGACDITPALTATVTVQ